MENKNKLFKVVIKYLVIIIICIFACFLLIFPKEVSNSIIKSINSCFIIVIPSLYAFIVISNILVKTNIYMILSKPFYLISRYLFRIPPELFSIFILSSIGGYPVGAKLISELVNEGKIDNKIAENMMCYCYCNSPAFFAGAIGMSIFGNSNIGLIVYLSVLISNIIIAICIGAKQKLPKKVKIKIKIKLNANIIIDSINSGYKTITMICFMLVFFSVIICFCDITGITNIITKIIGNIFNDITIYKASVDSIIEISQISYLEKNCYSLLPIISGIASFGGLCVILQIISLTFGIIKLKKFWISRIFSAIISAIICYLFNVSLLYDANIQTSFISNRIFLSERSFISSICLIIMSFILLFLKKDRFYKKGML